MTTFDTQATAKAKPPRAARKAVPNPYSRANILRRKVENLGLQIVLLAAFFALWEYAADRWVEKIMVSSPSDIWQVVTRWAQDGTYATNLAVTLEATVGGFVLGAVLGMGVGFLTGLWKRLGEVLQPILMALYTLPRLALAPLFLMWFGLGMEFRVVFAATIVFFLVYYNTFFGVREVSRDLINAVRIMGAGRFQVLVRVIVPSALVWVAAGLKISVPYALVGVVVAEMVAGNSGMGFLLSRAAAQFSAAQSFAAIFGLLVMALVLDWLITLLSVRALRWKSAGREEG
jgi:NitT/TauT family transport system permease protein